MTEGGAAVLTLTMNPSLDKSTETDRVDPGRKLRCGRIEREPGGGGINVSRVLRRLGRPTTAAFVRGGAKGEELQRRLSEEGVDQHPIPIGSSIRESLMVVESASGQQYRFAFPGPPLEASDVKHCLEAMRQLAPSHPVIVLSGSLPPGVPTAFYRELSERLSEDGARVIVDSSGEALRHATGAAVHLIKPNLGEFEALIGRSLPDDEAIETAARAMVRETPVSHIVVSLGAGGVALASEDGFERIASPTVPIRSRVGAGDSAVGGIAYGLVRGMEVPDAVRIGVAAGAATVMSPGTNLCRRDDVFRLYRGMTGTALPAGRGEAA